MKEKLLHFIWKLKLFSSKKLVGTCNETIHIISTGIENLDTGPDFLNSKIEINNQLWAGNVEIHINSSDWYEHNHQMDENYDSVILHVVWNHDVEVHRKSNQSITTLELKNFISKDLLINYDQLFSKNKHWINCEKDINKVDSFIFKNWIERLFFERLEQKGTLINKVFEETNSNWEATLFVLIAKNFGLKTNAEAFLAVALSFDFSILRKVSQHQNQLEALLFGQSGLLSVIKESEYHNQLRVEYHYLQNKFNLQPILKNEIQFFRLRPNNFPTIRLSQLASLYNIHQNLFSKLIEFETLNEFYNLFSIENIIFAISESFFSSSINPKALIQY